jgi:hypothetical protein
MLRTNRHLREWALDIEDRERQRVMDGHMAFFAAMSSHKRV